MTRLVVSLEGRVTRTGDGYATRSPHATETYWRKVHSTGCQVNIVARQSDRPISGAAHIDRPITVTVVPDFTQPRHLIAGGIAMVRRSWSLLSPQDAVAFVRLPGWVGFALGALALARRRELVVHVVGDPVLAGEGTTSNPAGAKALGRIFLFLSRFLGRRASTVFCVDPATARARGLVARGAAPVRKWNLDFNRIAFVDEPRLSFATPLTIATAGTQEQLYKGHDLLILALARLRDDGFDCRLRIAGDGRHRPFLEDLCRRHEVDHLVEFVGHLPGTEAVQKFLTGADLFALPSRTEGFPRVLVEAMALGLPCVATDVGAVAEVLPVELLIDTPQVGDIVARIGGLLADRRHLPTWAAVCHQRALAMRDEQVRQDEVFVRLLCGSGGAR